VKICRETNKLFN